MFKVVPDQLKISDGWVRCGHCADVFDATLYLDTWKPPVSTPQQANGEPSDVRAPASGAAAAGTGVAFEDGARPPLTGPDRAVQTSAIRDPKRSVGGAVPASADGRRAAEPPALPAEDRAEDDEKGDWLSGPAPSEEPMGEEARGPGPGEGLPTPAIASAGRTIRTDRVVAPRPRGDLVAGSHSLLLNTEEDEEADFHAELRRFAAASAAAAVEPAVAPTPPAAPAQTPQPARAPTEAPPPKPARAPTRPAVPAPPPVSKPLAPKPEASPDEGEDVAEVPLEPGFMRQARRRAFWHTPGMRALLATLVVLLATTLAAQWSLHNRDQLAARQPALAPLLSLLCEPLGCEVGPVRQIDAVVIDSSTLVRRLGNFYSFDLVLKNNASMPVAVPALELSLTDVRDAVLSRRVFLPEELPGAPALLPAQGSLPVSLRLSINDAGASPMAGYRALVFYP